MITRAMTFLSAVCFLLGPAPFSTANAQAVLLGDKFVPAWLTTGDLVAFSNEQQRLRFVPFTMQPDGSHLTRFLDRDAIIGDITRAGRVLYWSRTPDGRLLFSARLDGTDERRLTNGPSDASAVWSPDGKRIVYVGTRDGRSAIYVMNADGTQSRAISDTSTTDNGRLSWSPGDQIAFTNGIREGREVYVMRADGSGRHALTTNTVADFSPAFSLDGKRIAYTENPTRGSTTEADNRIFIMNADGSDGHQIGDISPIHGGVSWSGNGDELVFNAFGRLPGSELNIELFAISADGRRLRQLTTQPPQPVIVALEKGDVAAAHEAFLTARAANPLEPPFSYAAMRRLGNRYLIAKTYDKAIAAFTLNAEAFGAEDPDKWTDLAEVYKEAGDLDRATKFARQALARATAGPDRDRADALLRSLNR